jgi:DNA polymerase V
METIYPLKRRGEKSVLISTLGFASAGEPMEVERSLERIDLNEFLTGGNDGVFLIQANGDSMNAEIKSGDWLIVNRNLQANSGDKVLIEVNGKFTIKNFQPFRNGLRLIPSNRAYSIIHVSTKDSCEVFGVVTHVLHSFKKI